LANRHLRWDVGLSDLGSVLTFSKGKRVPNFIGTFKCVQFIYQLWDFIVDFGKGKWVMFVKLLKDFISSMLLFIFLLFNFLHHLLEQFDFHSFLRFFVFMCCWVWVSGNFILPTMLVEVHEREIIIIWPPWIHNYNHLYNLEQLLVGLGNNIYYRIRELWSIV